MLKSPVKTIVSPAFNPSVICILAESRTPVITSLNCAIPLLYTITFFTLACGITACVGIMIVFGSGSKLNCTLANAPGNNLSSFVCTNDLTFKLRVFSATEDSVAMIFAVYFLSEFSKEKLTICPSLILPVYFSGMVKSSFYWPV